jgi:hypothetical protein
MSLLFVTYLQKLNKQKIIKVIKINLKICLVSCKKENNLKKRKFIQKLLKIYQGIKIMVIENHT